MLSPFQQQARLRKFVYIGGILLLFTAALLLRLSIIEPEATRLQLREQTRGEVALTDSGLRLTLTGSRGLVSTYLWLSAIEKFKKHEWNELDLLVRSITKLQPHFLSPWLFQSWNLAFNVAVECDQPRDKYYYITRGIELLAEGERRNQGSDNPDPELRFPGSPELRHNIGFFYQLKIGSSDEQNVMRCFFDMSCIDPTERDKEALTGPAKAGRGVLLPKFKLFCERYPRLVRRLSERLRYEDPEEIVAFMDDNKEIPSRFKKPAAQQPGGQSEPTPLQEPEQQFPVLPGKVVNPRSRDLSSSDEDFNVFTACRYWYLYAQTDLTPPNPRPGVGEEEIDLRKYRQPKMTTYIFRGYPARAQAYIAENLEKEGFFDGEGWTIKKWFEAEPGPGGGEVRVGTEPKYWAQPAWEKAYVLYLKYGTENGMYFSPADYQAMVQKAELACKTYGFPPGNPPPQVRPEARAGAMGPSLDAARIFFASNQERGTANYANRLNEAEAEKTAEAVLAQKLFFQADRLRRFEDSPELALEKYEQAWPIWLDVLLAHPEFRTIDAIQEDTYEIELKYSRLLQKEYEGRLFHPLTTGLAQMALWPHLPFHPLAESRAEYDRAEAAKELLQALGLAEVPEIDQFLKQWKNDYETRRAFAKETTDALNLYRHSKGPFEILAYDGGQQSEGPLLRDALLLAAGLAVEPGVPLGEGWLTRYQKNRILTVDPVKGPHWRGTSETGRDKVTSFWKPVISRDAINAVRDRFGLSRPPTPESGGGPPSPAVATPVAGPMSPPTPPVQQPQPKAGP